MNSLSGDTAQPGARTGVIAFDRTLAGLTGIAVKGFLLSLVTFGIYRFWYVTSLRRFFWSRTTVDGSPGEYTGTGKELFLGFLVALAILVPVYIAVFAVSLLSPQLAPLGGVLSFAVLFVLGQFAVYRGRRYRAGRTLWRGIRLGQDGSAWTYAGLAAGWSLLTVLTLGLAFPFMRASLERYRIGHTLIGTSRMSSSATGTAILPYWLLFYAVTLLPVLACAAFFLVATKFSIPTDLFVPKPGGKASQLTMNPAYAGTAVATAIVVAGFVLPIGAAVAALLVPFYRARETRVFMAAASLGPVRLSSTLKARQFYWPYILYFLSILGFIAMLGVVGLLLALVATGMGGGNGASVFHGFLALGVFVAYLGGALLFAVLYIRIIQARLWAAVATTTVIEDAGALNEILASSRGPGSGLNEGLADALDVGGALEIGF